MITQAGYCEDVEQIVQAIKTHQARIKRFVKRYGERASLLLRFAARARNGNIAAREKLLRFAVSAKEVDEALALAYVLGSAAAPVVPEMITAYYGGWNVDTLA